jgi:hypothetical protein
MPAGEPSALVGSTPPESMAPVEIGTEGGRSSIKVTVPVAPPLDYGLDWRFRP